MKRLALAGCICLFFNCSSHASVLQTLSKITLGQIGNKIKTITTSNDFLLPTTMAFRSDSTIEAAANLLTIPVYAYNPALGVAASAVIGFAFNATSDVKPLYNDGLLQQKQSFVDLMNQLFGIPTSYPSSIDTVQTSCGLRTPVSTIAEPSPTVPCGSGGWYLPGADPSVPAAFPANPYITCTTMTYFWHKPECGTSPNGEHFYKANNTNLLPSSNPISWPVVPPVTLSDTQANQLAQNIANALKNNPQMKQDLQDLIVNNPSYITNAPQITKNDVQNWYTTNNQTINNQYINNLEQLAADNPDNIEIKVALEQAKADAQKEEETPQEETFSSISPSGFDEPYDPGEFDISGRFTAFLGNVKSSGLFSFSTGFFNSLPGGGSSVYEIDGGETFGHHSIDLSDTLTGGLAILKTILLAIFGFLSIRAVIMKR